MLVFKFPDPPETCHWLNITFKPQPEQNLIWKNDQCCYWYYSLEGDFILLHRDDRVGNNNTRTNISHVIQSWIVHIIKIELS